MSTAKVTPEQAVAALEQVPKAQRESIWERMKKKFGKGERVPDWIRDQDMWIAVEQPTWWQRFLDGLNAVKEGVMSPIDSIRDRIQVMRHGDNMFAGGRKTQKSRRHRKSTRRTRM